jgi:hypothetical protein
LGEGVYSEYQETGKDQPETDKSFVQHLFSRLWRGLRAKTDYLKGA